MLMSRHYRLKLLFFIPVVFSIASASQEPYAKIRETGPTHLFITYRCALSNRVALRRYMIAKGLPQLDGWRRQGLLTGYHVLFNRYADAETWDMAVLLAFRTFADVDRWKQIELTDPAGLAPEGLQLVTSATTYSMDLLRHDAATNSAKPDDSIFFVIPYDYAPNPTDAYVSYVDGYVVPQLKGWLEEGAIAAYSMYISRFSTSRSWSALLVLEYRGAEGFSARDRVIAKVRARLAQDPEWKKWSEDKQKMRVEKETVVADELLAR